jgi:dihydropteroate synthase
MWASLSLPGSEYLLIRSKTVFELCSQGQRLSLSEPLVMGILNVTPDSFSDGGAFSTLELACRQADAMVAQGAKIIDVGGESTRPGADEVSLQDELARVIPAIEYIVNRHQVWISIDTSKPEVMQAAVAAGAHMINDVRALQAPGALAMAAKLQVPVCLMHMQGEPRSMQASPHYEDVVADILAFFERRIAACIKAGLARELLLFDPGFGFGKTLEHNYRLLAGLQTFETLKLPLLIGLSRKSMIGNLLGRPTDERLAGSLAGAVLAAERGAHILRVHDVAETVDAVKVLQAMRDCR